MKKLAIIDFKGNFVQGFSATVKIWNSDRPTADPIAGKEGFLPGNSELLPLYKKWVKAYENYIKIAHQSNVIQDGENSATFALRKKEKISNASLELDKQLAYNNCTAVATELLSNFNNWLKSSQFSLIFEELKIHQPQRILIESNYFELRKMPWQKWDLLESQNFTLTEVGLTSPNFQSTNVELLKTSQKPPSQDGVKILVVLGKDANIESTFEKFQKYQCDVTVVRNLSELDVPLWEKSWDILIFNGHSKTQGDGQEGIFQLSDGNWLTISDIKGHFRQAINHNLKLAIFNSCDGLGLAYQLAEGEDLHLPQIIVMRENLPVAVAPKFLQYFLENYTQGLSLYSSLRESRQRLQILEKDFPCVSWLPVLCQNPAEIPPLWQDFLGVSSEAEIKWHDKAVTLIKKQKELTTNSLTFLDDTRNFDDIFIPLGLVERKQLSRRDDETLPEQASELYTPDQYEISQTYQQEQFLSEVLQQGKTGKSQGKRLAIIGEPGAGKTTVLQKIADWVLTTYSDQIPIYIPLADLSNQTLEEYIFNNWLKDCLALWTEEITLEIKTSLRELFVQGKVWLFLDAADEMSVSGANPLTLIKKQITGFIVGARVILTCRLNVWDGEKNALADFDTYRTLEFTEEQVSEFIERWYKTKPNLSKILQQQLAQQENLRIRDLIKNPLRLVLLCRIWENFQGELPETQAELYKLFVQDFYVWKSEEFFTTFEQRRELNKALGKLALMAINQEKSRFRLTRKLIDRVCDEETLHLATQIGWLNHVGVALENPQEKVYAFYHATFQEYFAALAVDDWDYFLPKYHVNFPVPGKRYLVFEPQWKQVILLWLGRNDLEDWEKDEFIKKLVNFNDGCYYNLYDFRALFLAATGITEFKKCKLSDDIIERIVELALDKFDFYNKRFNFSGNLIENLDVYWSNMEISSLARELLAHTIKEKVVAKLVKILKTTIDQDICIKVVKCLKKIPFSSELAISPLIELLETTTDTDIRKNIAECLGRIDSGNELAIQALTNLLETTTDKSTCWIVAYSLGQIDPGNQLAIKELIWNNRSWGFLKKSLNEINFGEKRAIITRGNKMAIRELTTLLETTTDTDISPGIAKCLGQIDPGNHLAISTLTNLLETTTDKFICLDAAKCLGQIDPGNHLAISTLTNLLETTTDAQWRINFAESLGQIDHGNQLAIESLIEVLIGILETAVNEDSPRSFTDLLKNGKNPKMPLEENDRYLCNDAVVVLSKISPGNELAIQALIQLLESADAVNCLVFADYLIQIAHDNEMAIQELTRLVETTTDVFIGAIIAICLGTVDPGNQLAIKTLTTLLQTSTDRGFRSMLAGSLWEIDPGNQQAISELVGLYEWMASRTDKESISSFSDFSKMIWQATQKLSYPNYFQVFHYNTALATVDTVYNVVTYQASNIVNAVAKEVNVVAEEVDKWIDQIKNWL